jgi:hypothetical protein
MDNDRRLSSRVEIEGKRYGTIWGKWNHSNDGTRHEHHRSKRSPINGSKSRNTFWRSWKLFKRWKYIWPIVKKYSKKMDRCLEILSFLPHDHASIFFLFFSFIELTQVPKSISIPLMHMEHCSASVDRRPSKSWFDRVETLDPGKSGRRAGMTKWSREAVGF